MKKINFMTAALAGAMLAGFAMTSCKKDDKGISPSDVSVDVFKQIPPRVQAGLYGNVKQRTEVQYLSSSLTLDTVNIDVVSTGGKKQRETTTEYNDAGFRTLDRTVQYDFNYGANGTEVNYKNEDAYTFDDKNRTTKREHLSFDRWCNSSSYDPETGTTCTEYYVYGDTSTTTYTYDDAAKKCTVISKNGRGVEQYKQVYDLNEDGTIDNGNYERYDPVVSTSAFAENPSSVTKTIIQKDGQGNITRRAYIQRSGTGWGNVYFSLTTYDITY